MSGLIETPERALLHQVAQLLDANARRVMEGGWPLPSELVLAAVHMEHVLGQVNAAIVDEVDEVFPVGLIAASNAVKVAVHMGTSGDRADAAVFASGARAIYGLLAAQ